MSPLTLVAHSPSPGWLGGTVWWQFAAAQSVTHHLSVCPGNSFCLTNIDGYSGITFSTLHHWTAPPRPLGTSPSPTPWPTGGCWERPMKSHYPIQNKRRFLSFGTAMVAQKKNEAMGPKWNSHVWDVLLPYCFKNCVHHVHWGLTYKARLPVARWQHWKLSRQAEVKPTWTYSSPRNVVKKNYFKTNWRWLLPCYVDESWSLRWQHWVVCVRTLVPSTQRDDYQPLNPHFYFHNKILHLCFLVSEQKEKYKA